MECRISSTADPEAAWCCRISIRWEFDADGNRLDDIRKVPFGPSLTDMEEVEDMLRKAQAAVLSPHLPIESFLSEVCYTDQAHVDASMSGKGSACMHNGALSFSRNVICVDVFGPDLVDLCFVDLPGEPHYLPAATPLLSCFQVLCIMWNPRFPNLSMSLLSHMSVGQA